MWVFKHECACMCIYARMFHYVVAYAWKIYIYRPCMRVRPCRSEIKGHYAVCCMCYEAFGIGNDTALVVHKDCKNLTSMPCSNVKKRQIVTSFSFFFSFYLSVFLILLYFSCLSEMVSSSKRVSVLFILFLFFSLFSSFFILFLFLYFIFILSFLLFTLRYTALNLQSFAC